MLEEDGLLDGKEFRINFDSGKESTSVSHLSGKPNKHHVLYNRIRTLRQQDKN
jgi:hypothetical protein